MESVYSEDAIKALNKFADACHKFIAKVVKTLKPFLQKVKEVCEKIWDLAWQSYREHQMPYGETDEGMLRWWKETCSIARTREALRRDLAWRALLTIIGDNNAFARDANPQVILAVLLPVKGLWSCQVSCPLATAGCRP